MKRMFTLMVVLASSFASAQTAPSKLEEKKVVTYRELERGFFFEGRGGFWGVINPPAASGTRSYFSVGQAVGVDMGVDIGERVSPSLFFLATANRMLSDYTGLGTKGTASGDFGALIPGVAVKVRLVGLPDAQDVQRTWVYVRVGGGGVFYSPAALLPTKDVLITGGAGIEYYTRLRHFVVGVEANFNFMVLTRSMGFAILPTVKYAF